MLKKKKKEKHYTYPVRDVSHYIIVYSNKKDYGVSNLKLQKLLYFVQAFFLINDCPPCFDEKIEAWDFGPVVPEIYREYKRYGGMDIPTIDYYVKFEKKNIWNTERIYYEDIISDDDKEMIQAVVDKFAHCSATFLVNLTHNQDPWINAYVNGQRILMQKSYKKSANLKCFRNQSILRRSYFIKKSQRGISQNNEVSTSIYYAFRLIPKRYESFLFVPNTSFGI